MEYQPKKLIVRILEFAALIALSALLIRLAVQYLLEVWPALLIIAVVIAAAIVVWRYLRNRSRW